MATKNPGGDLTVSSRRAAASGSQRRRFRPDGQQHAAPSLLLHRAGIRIEFSAFWTSRRKKPPAWCRRSVTAGHRSHDKSVTFRSEFSRHGILAESPHDPQARARILELIEQLQHGKSDGAAQELGRIDGLLSPIPNAASSQPRLHRVAARIPGTQNALNVRAGRRHLPQYHRAPHPGCVRIGAGYLTWCSSTSFVVLGADVL